MQTVSLDSVSKVYGREFALHRVSLSCRAGETMVLVGDNGSGKTTLLALLATLEAPTRGEITYDDVGWETFADDHRQRVGWIAHDSLLDNSLSVREDLELYAHMYELDDVDDRVDHWLERVGLFDDADQRVAHYSRGMTQRLSTARALLQDPELLLLDEPLSGLDRSGRKDVLELLDELRSRQHVVVVASHALSTIGTIADRTAILRSGELAYVGELTSAEQLTSLYGEHA
jgi:ABC-type multidrug transport system ATPase subunit